MKQSSNQSSKQSTQPSTRHGEQHAESEARKPFVAPTLTREAELTEATAERSFTFSMAS